MKTSELTADDLSPLVDKLSSDELVRLIYYAQGIRSRLQERSGNRHAEPRRAARAAVPLRDLRGLLHRPGTKAMTCTEMDEAIMQAVCEENGL